MPVLQTVLVSRLLLTQDLAPPAPPAWDVISQYFLECCMYRVCLLEFATLPRTAGWHVPSRCLLLLRTKCTASSGVAESQTQVSSVLKGPTFYW